MIGVIIMNGLFSAYSVIDLVILAVIVFFTLRGFFKGLIMAIAGAVTVTAAIIGAYFAASMFSHHIEGVIESPVSRWVENRMENIGPNAASQAVPSADSQLFDLLHRFGLNDNLIPFVSDSINSQIDRATYTFQAAITSVLVSAAAHILTYIIAFILIYIALSLAARLLDTVAKLPILNTANKIGGLVGGLLQGVLLVWLAVYVLKFVGVLGESAFEGTYLLRLFG